MIAENLWFKVDDDGYHHQILDCIVGHRSDDKAIAKGDELYMSKSQRSTQKKTTKGWYINIQWKDGSSSLKKMVDVNESITVPLAEYALKV